ncbi:hypothetical protein DAEQUDRAFT_762851 [Daedalea quercina L-15889]|uniref:Uncharacterized protein n=1 Tax=Daedalea quercina L-15889 TaxID=1314783 RepID=A0A165SVR1_9APHY|nr:hypothetical protein DAEQUDRAFT_762851 [Daedalea quercina L-15889]
MQPALTHSKTSQDIALNEVLIRAMCHYRQVNYYYIKCGHSDPKEPEEIHCEYTSCKFSPNHRTDDHKCKEMCWQSHQFPQQFTRQIDAYCPACVASGQ